MTKPTMDAVHSSNVVAIGYDHEARQLHVEFRGGSYYIYDEVPAQVHQELMAADSKGAFHANRIKNQYKYRKV